MNKLLLLLMIMGPISLMAFDDYEEEGGETFLTGRHPESEETV